jgi:aldose 1-epimerase
MNSNSSSIISLHADRFRTTIDGSETALFTLINANGMVVKFTNLGAKILQIIVPDHRGVMDDVALGYDSISSVITGQTSMGAFIGRYAGRVAKGRFALNGKPVQLGINSGDNSLHGGVKGSRFRVFEVTQLDAATCELKLDYADGEEGYPGKLQSRIVYRVTDDNALDIRYEATTDAPTIVNFTSHGFFNLAGHAQASEATMSDHVLTIPATTFTPNGEDLVPSGELRAVEGTPLDFRQPTRIGARINDAFLMHPSTRGYDFNWVVDKTPGAYALAATLYHPATGREMQVHSTEPGLVFFSGNNFTGESPRDVGKGGKVYHCRAGLCLEPGKFPDTPNHANFPSAVLNPGETYAGRITYRFATRAA